MDDLRTVAAKLATGAISIDAACERARDAILGQQHGTGRVLRSAADVQRDIAGLSAYVNEHALDDPAKWAGTLLMLHVQLAIGDPGLAVKLGRSVVQVSRGTCPVAAKRFAVAIIDTLLARRADLMPAELDLFTEARKSYGRVS